MIPFPPFLGGNPYYRRSYNMPQNPYIPSTSNNIQSNDTYGASIGSPHTKAQNKVNFENKTNVNSNYSWNNLNDRENKFKSSEKCSSNDSNKSTNEQNKSEPFFSIFGIDLYFDDILILALLLFLNNEDVKDNYLYIVLIMLLLN